MSFSAAAMQVIIIHNSPFKQYYINYTLVGIYLFIDPIFSCAINNYISCLPINRMRLEHSHNINKLIV